MNAGSIQVEGSYDNIKASESFSLLGSFEKVSEDEEKTVNEDDEDNEVKFVILLTLITKLCIIHGEICFYFK